MAAKDRDELYVDQAESLRGVRSWLKYARSSSPPDALFTVSGDIGMLYGTPFRPLDSERHLAEYAIDFVNRDTDRSRVRAALKAQNDPRKPAEQRGRTVVERARLDHVDGRTMSVEQQLEFDLALIEQKRAEWREFLTDVMRDRRAAADGLMTRAENLLTSMWPLPELRRTPRGGIELRHHPVILDLNAFDAYAQLLLVGDELGSELCQCQLGSCGRFFLMKKPKTGRPQRRYCTPKHMLDAHALTSTERAQKSRARKARRAK